MKNVFIIVSILLIGLSSCSSSEGSDTNNNKDTPKPKSSLADSNENLHKPTFLWDGRMNGCKSRQ